MGKVLWHVMTSLDGFVAGPGDTMDWSDRGDHSPAADEVPRTTGALLIGRRMYDLVEKEPRAKLYGGAISGPIFVLTHRPADDPDVTFLTGDLSEAVDTARTAAGDKNLLLMGAGVAGQCARLGLVDEMLVHLFPVLLGDGIRLFDDPGGGPFHLHRTACTESGQVIDLRFRRNATSA